MNKRMQQLLDVMETYYELVGDMKDEEGRSVLRICLELTLKEIASKPSSP